VTISSGTSSAEMSGSVDVQLAGPVIVHPQRMFFSTVEVT
jgi:hypothetical protein